MLYDGELAERIARARAAVSLDDLAAYEVIEREPLGVEYPRSRVSVEPAAVERRAC